MPNRYLWDVMSQQRAGVLIAGAFRPNGSSAIDNTLNKGVGFTVARSNTGLYTVTFSDKYNDWVTRGATLAMNALTDTQLQLGAIDLAAKTLLIRAGDYDGDGVFAAVDIADHANNWVNFWVLFKNTSLVR